MKPTGLGHERVKSPDTACARVEASSMERPGRPATAVCQGGVLSGIVVGGWESQPHGEGPDGSTQPAKETRAGHAGSDQREPTSLRGIANRAKESKHHRFRNLFQEVNAELLMHCFVDAGLPAGVLNMIIGSGGEVGNTFVDHPDVRLVSFTGSTRCTRVLKRKWRRRSKWSAKSLK